MNYEKESEQEQHILLLSNGSSLALFVGRVIDANVIIQKNEKEKMI